MSRKSNKLREQLRFARERSDRFEKLFAKATRDLATLRRQLADEKASAQRLITADRDSLAKSIMIDVNEDRFPWDRWAVQLTFPADGYAMHTLRRAREPINATYIAAEIGYRIGRMVADAIEKKLQPGAARGPR